ncbi:MAG TPA: DRTGG domain-containing protein [Thermodesulfobacteriota bacterium]|jgi:BioD-like phosphotransacetylase family protein|nr:DRTGG domain-containing protein [Thermodesulfobacteriota bacterium]
MTVFDIAKSLGLKTKAAKGHLDEEVTGGYASDLLSDVIAHSRKGSIWVTIQTHPNIVAVASMKELAGIILAGGREPDADTLKKAEEEEIPILVSPLFTYEVVGKLYQMGISGMG